MKPFKWLTVIFLLILFPLILSLGFRTLIDVPYELLLLKSFIDTLLILGFAILLEKIIASSNYVKLDFNQRLINYIAFAVIAISAWVALIYLSSTLLFGIDKRDEIIRILPVTALIGLLLYLVGIQFNHYKTTVNNVEKGDENNIDIKIENNEKVAEPLERIALKTGQKIHVILVTDIVYIQSDGDYVQIFTENGKYIKEDTMKYFVANLRASQFVRVHRSYIVNVEKITRIELYEKNNQMLILKNGHQVKVSTSGYKMLRDVLNL